MSGINSIARRRDFAELASRLFAEGKTVDEVQDELENAGFEVSRSTVGRYRLHWLKAVQHIQDVKSIADVALQRLEDTPESKLARQNIETIEAALHAAVVAVAANMEKDPAKALDKLETAAKTQSMLTRAAKDDAERTIRVEEYARKKGKSQVEGNRGIEIRIVNPDGSPFEHPQKITLPQPKALEPQPDSEG